MTVKSAAKQVEPASATDLFARLEQARDEAARALERAQQRASDRTDGALRRARIALGLATEDGDEIARLEQKLVEIDCAAAELRDDVRRERERAADQAWQAALPKVVAARRGVERAARRLVDAAEEADDALMQARIAGAAFAPMATMIFGFSRDGLRHLLRAFESETDVLQVAFAPDGTLHLRLLSDCDAGKRGETVSLPARAAIPLLRAGGAEPADPDELAKWRVGQG